MLHPGQPSETKTLHFDMTFDGTAADGMAFLLHTGHGRHPLQRHTAATRDRFRAVHPVLGAMAPDALARITHYVEEVELPSDVARMLRITVVTETPAGRLPPLAATLVHVPAAALRRSRARRLGRIRAGRHAPLDHLGMTTAHLAALSDADLLDRLAASDTVMQTPLEIAKSIAFRHPQLSSTNPDTAATVMDQHISEAPDLRPFATAISKLGVGGWSQVADSLDPKGNALVWGPTWPSAGQPVQQYNLVPAISGTQDTSPTIPSGPAVLSYSLKGATNDDTLYNKLWSVNQGSGGVRSHASATASRLAIKAASRSAATAAAGSAGSAYSFTINNKTPGYGVDIDGDSLNYTPLDDGTGNGQLTVNVKNSFLRTLGCYAQFKDMDGTPIDNPSGWDEYFSSSTLRDLFEPSASKKFIDEASVVNTILGIPMPTDPTTLSFVWPSDAASCDLLLGGLGTRAWDNDVDWYGVVMTGAFQYAVPSLLLVAGAQITNSGWYKSIMRDKELKFAFYAVMAFLFAGYAGARLATQNTKSVLFSFGDMAAGLIAHEGLEKLANYIGNVLIDNELIDAIPFAGEVFRVANMAIDLVGLTETTVEVLISPATYDIAVTRELAARVTVSPDPAHGSPTSPPIWPLSATTYQSILQFKDGTTFTASGNLPSDPNKRDQPVEVDYDQLPTGNQFQVVFSVYSSDDWLAGKWVSPWVPALAPAEGPLTLSGAITEALTPLTASTQYIYKQKLGYDTTAAAHVWIAGNQPTALVGDLNGGASGANLAQLAGITINNRASMLGYTWEASGQNLPFAAGAPPTDGQIFAFQNINVLADPETGLKFPSIGFASQPFLAYDQFGSAPLFSLDSSYSGDLGDGTVDAKLAEAFAAAQYPLPKDARIAAQRAGAEWFVYADGSDPTYDIMTQSGGGYQVRQYAPGGVAQNNFYVDTRVAGQYHLRKVVLDATTPFDMQQTTSYGYFTLPHPAAVLIHPAGYAVSLNYESDKMEIIKLPDAGGPDADAEPAVLASGTGVRQGLLGGPRAAAVTPDGRILVLEADNQRIQSFDLNGNPAPTFDGGSVATLAAADYAGQLDGGVVTMALRQAVATKATLSAHWHVLDGNNVVDVLQQADGGLLATCNGGSVSNAWTISVGPDPALILQATLAADGVAVTGTGPTGPISFTLPLSSVPALDTGTIDGPSATIFGTNGVTLAQPITVTGNALVLDASLATSLCADAVPTALTEALAARQVTLTSAAKVSQVVTVTVQASGALWVIRDGGTALSYRVTVDTRDASQLQVSLYSPMAALVAEQSTVTYLDMATEAKGYIYVLGYLDAGTALSDYFVDIYDPTGARVTRTPNPDQPGLATGVNAGRLAVDLWRTMYTLNFEHFAGPGGRTEPSVGVWMPTTPAT